MVHTRTEDDRLRTFLVGVVGPALVIVLAVLVISTVALALVLLA